MTWLSFGRISRRLAFVSYILLSLAACGGGGGGGSIESPSAPANPPSGTGTEPPSVPVTPPTGGGTQPPPVQAISPSITAQPSSQTLVAGSGASFTVAAAGDPPLTYQWQRNGADLPGATSSTLGLLTVLLPDQGSSYAVRVSNGAGSVLSSSASLDVQPTGTISLVAGSVTVAAGTLTFNLGYADGPAASAQFRLITGLAVDSAGNIVVTDTGNQIVRKISPAGQVTTYAGSPGVAGGGFSSFNNLPAGLAIDSSDTLYLADSWGLGFGINWWQAVRTVTPTGVPPPFSRGTVVNDFWQGFVLPASVAVDAAGNVYTSGRRITPAGVATVLPTPASLAAGLAVGPDGTLYMAADNSVWKLPPGQATTALVAGTSSPGAIDGVGQQARFKFISNNFQLPMVLDSASNLYLCDQNGIRRVSKDGVVTTLTGRPGLLLGKGIGDLADKPIITGALAMRGDKTLYFEYSGAVFKLELP